MSGKWLGGVTRLSRHRRAWSTEEVEGLTQAHRSLNSSSLACLVPRGQSRAWRAEQCEREQPQPHEEADARVGVSPGEVNRHSWSHCWLADARVGVSPLQLGRISLSHTQEHAQPRRRAATAAAAATAIASAINAAAAAEVDLSVERGAVGGACEA